MSNALIAPHFQSHEAARDWLEARRWPEGPVCHYCGTINHAYQTKKAGWYRCAEKGCRKDFTVTMGTVMERSHIPLNKWLVAFYLMCASKKGVSAHQLHRSLGIDYKSAWFMAHRIREAMRSGGLLPPMGEDRTPVEVDETYIGRVKGVKIRQGSPSPACDRVAGGSRDEAGPQLPRRHATSDQIAPIVRANVSEEARFITDQATWYKKLGTEFVSHEQLIIVRRNMYAAT